MLDHQTPWWNQENKNTGLPVFAAQDAKTTNLDAKKMRYESEDKPAQYLDIGKVHFIEIRPHLVDLTGILQHSSCSLCEVVQRSIPTQGLRKGTYSSNL